jgi:hypothetical protein
LRALLGAKMQLNDTFMHCAPQNAAIHSTGLSVATVEYAGR